MKQFKAEWVTHHANTVEEDHNQTINHLITQHNALCDYLAERDRVRVNDQSLPTLLEWNKQAIEQAEGHEIEAGKQTITLPKPEWWKNTPTNHALRISYQQALEAASKASGITFLLEI